MKTCAVCKIEKELSEFYNYQASKDGKAWRCKECDNNAGKAYRIKHKNRVKILHRNARIRNRFKLEPEDYDSLVDSQDGVCAICQLPPEKSNMYNHNLVVDHNHKTGLIRGLLCHKCNQALGLFKDKIENLKRALKYLKENN